jgi:hypothetical protein
MATYRVECSGTVRELYVVEADSPEEAMAKWTDGALVLSEASTSPVSAEPEED